MIKKELKNLLEEVKNNVYSITNKELFEGAGIVICKAEPEANYDKSYIYVISNYAYEISSLIFKIKELFGDRIDYINKFEFYGRLAKSAIEHIKEYGDNIGVIKAIINEAINVNEEWNRVIYFAYGSNIDDKQMADRCSGSKFIRTAIAEGYKFALDCSGAATIIADKDSKVQGVLWSITKEDMTELDKREGVGNGCYRKETIKFSNINGENNDEINALVYISNRDIRKDKSRLGYMEKIINAAKSLEFEENYIAELESHLR